MIIPSESSTYVSSTDRSQKHDHELVQETGKGSRVPPRHAPAGPKVWTLSKKVWRDGHQFRLGKLFFAVTGCLRIKHWVCVVHSAKHLLMLADHEPVACVRAGGLPRLARPGGRDK